MATRPFVVHVGRVLRSQTPRRATITAEIPDLFVTGSEVPPGAEVTVDVELLPLGATVEAAGEVRAPWRGECRRCLKPVHGEVAGEVREAYEAHPEEGESYPLVHDEIDLEPMARETILLELPAAPLCKEDCAGLCPECGADRNEGDCSCAPPADPRWAVLDELRDT